VIQLQSCGAWEGPGSSGLPRDVSWLSKSSFAFALGCLCHQISSCSGLWVLAMLLYTAVLSSFSWEGFHRGFFEVFVLRKEAFFWLIPYESGNLCRLVQAKWLSFSASHHSYFALWWLW
jgi:hypothetical protein